MKKWVSLCFVVLTLSCHAAPRKARVFIALCDNKTQGIIPVGAKIGNGDDPDANLYWGCSDGFGSQFKRSGRWKVVASDADVSPIILRRLTLRHVKGDLEITADAYRGSAMRQCLMDFEKAASSNAYDLVAFLGHNGLMDFQLPAPEAAPGNDTEVAVLCCLSERHFRRRLEALGCKPVLMTSQLMYPGSFLLDAALERWREGGSLGEIRVAAATAYARNQKISVKSAMGVFADLAAKD